MKHPQDKRKAPTVWASGKNQHQDIVRRT